MGAKTPRHWYDTAVSVPKWAALLEPVYSLSTHLRRLLYRRGWKTQVRVAVPVLVVGNITAGGTGKTPMTIALVQHLLAAGWHPGVASRGYGRKQPGTPRWVNADTPVDLAGDEPALIAYKTGVPVRVNADRVSAANALIEAGCDVVVCDDGLQHYRLKRDIELEVVDASRGYGNGRLLPAGPLREPVARAMECDFRIINLGQGSRADASVGFGQWPMQLDISNAEPLMGGRAVPLTSFAGRRVHAVAGIAHPERFFSMLRNKGIAVVPHSFADHHAYVAEDLQFSSNLPILMTEKDAVKCTAFATPEQWAVPLQAELPAAFWNGLLERLESMRSAS